jgi:hypothetical protein
VSSVASDPANTGVAFLILGAGLPVYWYWSRRK